ncbi:MAG: hypothetical protein WB565_18180 [Acidimicrobiales bacterium]
MTVLSPLDDYPVHQISEPMRFVGTSDRNFYDRYYFNVHASGEEHPSEDDLFAVIGVGQYPNLGVADAFVSVLWNGTHRVVRASKTLGANRMDTTVGPIRVEVLRGLEQVRVVVEPNEWGVELDAVYQGFSEAHLEARHFDRQFERVIFDSTRFAQVGSWEGRLGLGDRELQLTPDRWWGTRDRSWGVRPVGEAEPPGIRATDAAGGFFWIYAPVRFEDHALVTIVQERPSGERVMQDAHRVFPIGSGREPEWLGRPEHELRFAPGSRAVTGATLSYFGARGQKTAEVEVETLMAFPLLLGTGYGLEPDWRHGMYQGELVVQGQEIPPADPSYSNWGLTEYSAKFTSGGQVGYGMFECAVMGPHRQYGFEGWE